LMATHSNGMSARQLGDQLGVTYKTAWPQASPHFERSVGWK
jgi:hypothetical protein